MPGGLELLSHIEKMEEYRRALATGKVEGLESAERIEFFSRLLDYLDNTTVVFEKQRVMNNELYQLLKNNKQYDMMMTKYSSYEILFANLFSELNDQEKGLHRSIRDLTQNLMIHNSRILSVLKSNPKYLDEIIEVNSLSEHLTTWLQKYDKKLKIQKWR